jgi:hypothetical protein
MEFGWGSPVGLGILLAGLGIFLWGAQASRRGKKED